MNTTTFESAKPGDKVWFIPTREWGTIAEIRPDMNYPIMVNFGGDSIISFTLDGKECISHSFQSLFWDEIHIIAPPKPLPKLAVDTKVLVWNHPNNKAKRHFSHFEDGKIYTFDNGSTSFTRRRRNSITSWSNWELAE